MSLLEVKNVSKSFGGVKANVDISVSVEQGSIVGLIGHYSSISRRRHRLCYSRFKRSLLCYLYFRSWDCGR